MPRGPKPRLSKREREVMQEWQDHTGWEFMEPHEGESFYDALQRNRRWLEQRLSESLAIGNDIQPPDDSTPETREVTDA